MARVKISDLNLQKERKWKKKFGLNMCSVILKKLEDSNDKYFKAYLRRIASACRRSDRKKVVKTTYLKLPKCFVALERIEKSKNKHYKAYLSRMSKEKSQKESKKISDNSMHLVKMSVKSNLSALETDKRRESIISRRDDELNKHKVADGGQSYSKFKKLENLSSTKNFKKPKMELHVKDAKTTSEFKKLGDASKSSNKEFKKPKIEEKKLQEKDAKAIKNDKVSKQLSKSSNQFDHAFSIISLKNSLSSIKSNSRPLNSSMEQQNAKKTGVTRGAVDKTMPKKVKFSDQLKVSESFSIEAKKEIIKSNNVSSIKSKEALQVVDKILSDIVKNITCNKPRWLCPICGRYDDTFGSESFRDVRNHILSRHAKYFLEFDPRLSKMDKGYKCLKCGLRFPDSHYLFQHLAFDHNRLEIKVSQTFKMDPEDFKPLFCSSKSQVINRLKWECRRCTVSHGYVKQCHLFIHIGLYHYFFHLIPVLHMERQLKKFGYYPCNQIGCQEHYKTTQALLIHEQLEHSALQTYFGIIIGYNDVYGEKVWYFFFLK